MFALKVVLNGVGETLLFRYKTADRATSHRIRVQALANMSVDKAHGPEEFIDDYGLSVWINPYTPVLVAMIDLDKMTEGDVEFEYGRRKSEQRAMTKASNGIISPARMPGGLLAS